jgi:hypothetical protein
MPRLTIILLVALTSAGNAQTPQPQTSAEKPLVRLARGTPIRIVLPYGVSSKAAKVGDPVYLRVAEAVQSQGIILIPEGSAVQAHVAEATPPGGLGRAGSIRIDAEAVTFEGGRIRLEGSLSAGGQSQRPGVAQGVVTVPLGSRGAAAKANLEAGTVFVATTARDF